MRSIKPASILLVLVMSGVAQAQKTEDFKLFSQHDEVESFYCFDVAMDGDVVVVGAPGYKIDGWYIGALFVYRLKDGAWEETKIVPSHQQPFSGFGMSVDISGDTIVTGANGFLAGYRRPVGAVYTYRFNGVSYEEQVLLRTEPREGDSFGREVAIDGNMIVASVPNAINPSGTRGAVVVFRDTGEGMTEHTLEPSLDNPYPSWWRTKVAVSGNRVVIGAPMEYQGGVLSGAFYIFEFDDGHWSSTRFTFEDRPWEVGFASDVAIDGDTVAVTAPRKAVPSDAVGSVFLYESIGGGWNRTQFRPSDGSQIIDSIAISGDRFIVGALTAREDLTGSAFLFSRNGDSWEESKLMASDAEPSDLFSFSAVLSSRRIVVGSLRGTGSRPNSGAGYVFEIPSDPLVAIAALCDLVIELVGDHKIAAALKQKLNVATKLLSDSSEKNDGAAVGALNAFVRSCQALRGKKLSIGAADALIAEAEAILHIIST